MKSSSHKATEVCAEIVVNWNGRALLPLPLLLLIPHKHRFTTHTSFHHVLPHNSFQSRYCSVCLGVSLYYTFSMVNKLQSSTRRLVLAIMKLAPLFILLNCTPSSQISLTVFVALILLGIISGQIQIVKLCGNAERENEV